MRTTLLILVAAVLVRWWVDRDNRRQRADEAWNRPITQDWL